MSAERKNPASFWLRLKTWMIWLLIKTMSWTVRVKVTYSERLEKARKVGKPIVYAFWHGRQLLLFQNRPEKKLTILASRSRDGELQSKVCERFGIHAARGSSSRGGLVGMVQMQKSLRAGVAVGLAVDGPRGPVFVAKPGVVALARNTGSPILPVSVGLQKYWELERTWDRFRIPRPFSKAVLGYGEPMDVPRKSSSQTMQDLANELTERLNRLTAELDQINNISISNNNLGGFRHERSSDCRRSQNSNR